MKIEKCRYYEEHDMYMVYDKRTETYFDELKMKKCKYDDENDTIKAKFDSNISFKIKCEKAERELKLNEVKCSKLIWLKYNEPKTYFNLIVQGNMQEYLDFINQEHRSQYSIIVDQLEKEYDKETAEMMAREIMMG